VASFSSTAAIRTPFSANCRTRGLIYRELPISRGGEKLEEKLTLEINTCTNLQALTDFKREITKSINEIQLRDCIAAKIIFVRTSVFLLVLFFYF
jgi:hypothetical protein